MVTKRVSSDAVLASREGAFLGALVAGSLDNKPVISHTESVGPSYLVADTDDLIACKFDKFPAFSAVEVIVLGVTVVQLVHAAAFEFEAVQQSGVYKFFKSSVDSWSRNVVRRAFGRKLVDQQICVEMLVAIEDLFEQEFFLGSVSQSL